MPDPRLMSQGTRESSERNRALVGAALAGGAILGAAIPACTRAADKVVPQGSSPSWPGVGGRWAGGPGGRKSFGAHVAFPDDPFVVLLDQQGTEEAGDGVAVREDTHDIGATTDLFVKPFCGLLERIFGQCSTGKALKARMSSAASRTYKAASQKPAVVSLSTTSPGWHQAVPQHDCGR